MPILNFLLKESEPIVLRFQIKMGVLNLKVVFDNNVGWSGGVTQTVGARPGSGCGAPPRDLRPVLCKAIDLVRIPGATFWTIPLAFYIFFPWVIITG